MLRPLRLSVCLLLSVVWGLSASTAAAQRLTGTVTIREGGASKVLTVGVDPAATNGIDAALGEAELPPFPPSGVFEARFVPPGDSISIGQGSYTDYRARTTNAVAARTHQLRFQRAAGGTVTVEWSFPEGMTAVAQDLFGGVIVNQPMTTRTGNFTVALAAVEALRLNVTYAARTATERSETVRALALAASPNPSHGSSVATYTLPAPGPVRVALHDALGRTLAVLADGPALAGVHRLSLPVEGLAPGLYVLTLDANGVRATERVTVVR